MSPFDPEPMEEENTDVVVARVRRAKRRAFFKISTPVVIALILVAVWAKSGQRSCGDRFWQGFERPTTRSGRVVESWVVNPNARTASVHITVSEPEKIWVDENPIGTFDDTTIELAPGTHDILTRTRRGGEMSTTLTVDAGEVFKVFFNRETRKIHLYRIAPGGDAIEVP